ncbi:MAG: YrbL family protein [Pseudomonadota bacterium]
MEKLKLSDSLIIGKGANRTCYRHPEDETKCIKIPHSKNCATQILESNYLKKLQKSEISWRHLSRYYGETDTNLGMGYSYELIQNYDQTISLSITQILEQRKTEQDLNIIRSTLDDFKSFIIEQNIIVRNLRPYNIVLRKDSPESSHAVLIDNFGHHNHHFHFSDVSSYFAKKRAHKKWNSFVSYLAKHYPNDFSQLR